VINKHKESAMAKKLVNSIIAVAMLATTVSAYASYMVSVPKTDRDHYKQAVPIGLTNRQVLYAIKKGAASKGWSTKQKKEGLVLAYLKLRGHTVAVRIPYTNKNYSIKYSYSEKMKYKNGRIHHKYAQWTNNLEKAIQVALANEALKKIVQ